MVCMKTWLVVTTHVVAVIVVLANGESQVPGLYIFGDSLADNGNNNNLPTNAKANYAPYGIDFPNGIPTGRFTDGLTSPDIIAFLLGFKDFIPPFANTSGYDIFKGVNYASGAAGIRFESGRQLVKSISCEVYIREPLDENLVKSIKSSNDFQGSVISLGEQIRNHKFIVSRITERLGSYERALEYLAKCLYYVNIGSNDYINNYFLPESPTRRLYTPEQYARVLVYQLSCYVEDLHDVGARKVVMVGLGAIGCIPRFINTTTGSCDNDLNAAAFLFNENLKGLVDRFNNKSDGSKFTFVNSTVGDLTDPSLGFTVFTSSCCPTRADGQCAEGGVPCSNRDRHIFMDEFHPTQAVNTLTASQTYNGTTPGFTDPVNIQTLVHS